MPACMKWWGEFNVPMRHEQTWRLGPLELRVARVPGEWRVGWSQQPDPFLSAVDVSAPTPLTSEGWPSAYNCMRFGVGDEGERIRLSPALADRSIVARPDTPLSLPGGEQIDTFVSSPLWIVLRAMDPDRLLMEIPTFRPKDSWLGNNTCQGLLCYGSRDPVRTRLADLPPHPMRAVSRVLIRNSGTCSVALTRVPLPAEALTLFVDESHRFWTQELSLELGPALAPVPGKAPPHAAGTTTVVANARNAAGQHHLLTTLGGILGS